MDKVKNGLKKFIKVVCVFFLLVIGLPLGYGIIGAALIYFDVIDDPSDPEVIAQKAQAAAQAEAQATAEARAQAQADYAARAEEKFKANCRDKVRATSKFPVKVDFGLYSWQNSAEGGVHYGGGIVELMNGFGSMIPHHYMCKRGPGSTATIVLLEPGG